MGVLAFLLGLTVFVWTATGLAGLLSHGAWPDDVTFGRTPLAVRELITEPHDIPGAWPSTPRGQLSGYGLFWGVFISQLMVLMVLTVFVMGTVARARAVRKARRMLRDRPGQEQESPREGGSPGSAEHRGDRGDKRNQGDQSDQGGAPTGEPGNPPPPSSATDPTSASAAASAPASAPGPGSAPGSASPTFPPPAQSPSAEAPLAPPQEQGAPTRQAPPVGPPSPLAPTLLGTAGAGAASGTSGGPGARGAGAEDPVTQILEAPGAALVSAATPDLWTATKTARAKLGPVHLFDPTHACDTPDRLRWSPHHGCADRATAASRATSLLAPLRSPRPIDATIHTTAETVLRCWLHAAALEKRPFREVHRWALATGQTADAVRILRTHPKATSGAAGELESALAGHPQLRADAVALIRRALAPLGRLHVRNACSAERADRLALESFIAEAGTLYVVGEDPEVLPLLNALTQSVVEHGRRMAARSSDGRLDPPLTSVLHLPTKP
ncbi:hypothetical protein JW613_34655 [Streptomyces smyrnaeus]|uniref:Type VI secretion protein n=1 Tax=Streptomyces smyrnaeus TaxID=1387713 RepID=A0ABS3Y6Z3_9ACTN|nr:hypothetical protein [Streptomyces smyrnaeus]